MHASLTTFLAQHETDQFRFLRELVLQPSHTLHKKGVDAVGTLITHELAGCQMTLETIEQSEKGNHLIFRSTACSRHSHSILLVGHMDTVFPIDSAFNWYREEGSRVYGPGIIDMKGGLVAVVYALKALHTSNLLAEIPITLICNSDEEMGSPTSFDLITAEAQSSMFALVFECGGLGGEIVTGRKGKTGYVVEVTGKAGHAAFAAQEKASAILELARKIIALEDLNDPARQLVVNVGVIEGGIGPNTIAENASALVDTRFLSREDGYACSDAISRIVTDCTVPGTQATLSRTSGRAPMEQTVRNHTLYHHMQQEAELLGIPLKAELRSGVSDANTIAATGTPVIDGLGPIGDCDHSDKEYMIRESLPARTALAAIGIATAWQQFRQGRLLFS